MNDKQYDKFRSTIFKNMEREKFYIHKNFSEVSVPDYLFYRLVETMQQAKKVAPCKNEAKKLIRDAMEANDLI